MGHQTSPFNAGLILVAVAGLAAVGCAGSTRRSEVEARETVVHDSHALIFNRSIGDVRLEMSRVAVERRYGKATRQKPFSDYFPVGTAYHGKKLVRVTYRLHRGELTLDYVRDRVKTISTTSAYYRSADGIGAGIRVPGDRCMRLDEIGHVGPRGCKSTWRAFRFDGEYLDAWTTTMRAKTITLLHMHRGRRIEEVRIGDADVILPYF